MIINPDMFLTAFPNNKQPEDWCDALNDILPQYSIDTLERVAAFLSQCGHESAGFTTLSENLNYSAQGLCLTFKKYFPTLESAQPYARKPQKIANRVYANRMGNGPESSGDGWEYRGRGPIQLTGKDNYTLFFQEMYPDYWEEYLGNPDVVSQEKSVAIASAIWFWNRNNLNRFADAGDLKELTRRINGGYNGLDHRIELYEQLIVMLQQ